MATTGKECFLPANTVPSKGFLSRRWKQKMTRPKPFPKWLGRSSLNWMKVTAQSVELPNPIHMNLNNLTTNDWKIAKPRLLSEQEFPYLMQDSIHVPVTRTSSIIHISYAIGGGPIRHVPFYGIPFPVSRLEPIPLIPALSLSPKDQRLLFGLDKQAGTGSSSRYHYNGEAHLPITGGELKGSKLLRSCFVSLKLWNLSRLTSTNLSLPDQVDHYRNPYRTRCFLGFASFWQRRPSPYALRDWAFGSHLIGLLSAVAEKCGTYSALPLRNALLLASPCGQNRDRWFWYRIEMSPKPPYQWISLRPIVPLANNKD